MKAGKIRYATARGREGHSSKYEIPLPAPYKPRNASSSKIPTRFPLISATRSCPARCAAMPALRGCAAGLLLGRERGCGKRRRPLSFGLWSAQHSRRVDGYGRGHRKSRKFFSIFEPYATPRFSARGRRRSKICLGLFECDGFRRKVLHDSAII